VSTLNLWLTDQSDVVSSTRLVSLLTGLDYWTHPNCHKMPFHCRTKNKRAHSTSYFTNVGSLAGWSVLPSISKGRRSRAYSTMSFSPSHTWSRKYFCILCFNQWRLQGRAYPGIAWVFLHTIYHVICLNILRAHVYRVRRRDLACGHGLWRSRVNPTSIEARRVHSHLCLPGLLLVSAGASGFNKGWSLVSALNKSS